MLETEEKIEGKPDQGPNVGDFNEKPEVDKTSDFYKTTNLPAKFEYPGCIKGYSRKRIVNPLYLTTSSEYGSTPPTIHTVPVCFYPKSLQFSKSFLPGGSYRNRSLNTALDKSYV